MMPARQRAACTFGTGSSTAVGLTPSAEWIRQRTTSEEFGGSLDQVLSSCAPRRQFMSDLPPRAWSPIRRAPAAQPAADFRGSLSDVRDRRPRTTEMSDDLPPRAWSPIRRAPAAQPAAEFRGSLGDVLDRRPRTSLRQFQDADEPLPQPPPPRSLPAAPTEWEGGLDAVLDRRPRTELRARQHDADEPQQPPPPPRPPPRRPQLVEHWASGDLAEALAAPRANVRDLPPDLPPSTPPAEEAAPRRMTRASPPSADEWGGGLGDVLRPRGQPAARPRAQEELPRRLPRATPPTAEEWGGGLGDVLRPPRGGTSHSRHSAPREPPPNPATTRQRSGGGGGRVVAISPEDFSESALDYDQLMQLHLRDNAHLARREPAASSTASKAPRLKSIQDVIRNTFRNVRAPRTKRRGDAKADGEEDEEAACCSICLDPLAVAGGLASSQRRPVAALPCDHQFHKQCITDAVKHKPCCPLCRFDLLRCAPATEC